MKTSPIFTRALFLGFALALTTLFFAFKPQAKTLNDPPPQYEYMQVNVLESVVQGGVGRSRMIVTDTNGKSGEPINLENYYSMAGINFGNVASNDSKVTTQLNLLGKEGWEVVSTTSGGNQVYFTKYLLKRVKK
ncbi:hypothetical protein [Hugenholtzia roseola]|uniref:hypothetical protein n=1 Tax=Hugenholtzia roseola TaxID=1002 RepID=UPI000411C431|nr:hypothetical protein [Hugenholtzia roseola]